MHGSFMGGTCVHLALGFMMTQILECEVKYVERVAGLDWVRGWAVFVPGPGLELLQCHVHQI